MVHVDDLTVCSARTPKRFLLYRRQDETGVSGTGVVATGVVWPDGHAALRWKADDHEAASSTSVWSSVADMMRVHGHGGFSEIIYIDGHPPQAGAPERACGRVAGPWAWPSR